ncbi:hypothetical protein [Vibrio mediterranei]|uniref:hypothetical protein n=1 Tax=Vibrio mediterranei TaxID=689 RepID=UPI004069480B
MARVRTPEAPLFPKADLGINPSKNQRKKRKQGWKVYRKPQVPPLVALMSPSEYPDDADRLEREMRKDDWDDTTPWFVESVQKYMLDDFELCWQQNNRSLDMYIDYALWVILDDETDSDFTFPNVVKNLLHAEWQHTAGGFARMLFIQQHFAKGNRLKAIKMIINQYEPVLKWFLVHFHDDV